MFFKLLGFLFIIPIVLVSIAVYRERLSLNYLIALFIATGFYFLIVGQLPDSFSDGASGARNATIESVASPEPALPAAADSIH